MNESFFSLLLKDFRAFWGSNRGCVTRMFVPLLSPEFHAVVLFRIYSALSRCKLTDWLAFILYSLSKIIYRMDIHRHAQIGGGFRIVHLGALVIGGHVRCGSNLTVQSGVTIGEARPGYGMPRLGNNIYIGTGAKVLGNITLADNCIVGANAVVIDSFDSSGVIVGIPASLKKNSGKGFIC
jgi:serine O-acetyltransferase